MIDLRKRNRSISSTMNSLAPLNGVQFQVSVRSLIFRLPHSAIPGAATRRLAAGAGVWNLTYWRIGYVDIIYCVGSIQTMPRIWFASTYSNYYPSVIKSWTLTIWYVHFHFKTFNFAKLSLQLPYCLKIRKSTVIQSYDTCHFLSSGVSSVEIRRDEKT